MNRVPLLIVGVVALSVTVTAQQPVPAFEVASIKPHTSDDGRVTMVLQPGGRFVATRVPLRHVIRTAFQLQDDQIVGGPEWLDTDRFDIDARSPDADVTRIAAMLQSLLADRFKLTTHRETRELSVLTLERARRDGTLGPELRPTACPAIEIDLSRPQPCANISNGSAFLTLRGMPLTQFTQYLAPYVNRVVVDRTGLDGRYDINLRWSPELDNQERPSLFTALQEQLGLKLESGRGMVEVLVIDTVAHPTPN